MLQILPCTFRCPSPASSHRFVQACSHPQSPPDYQVYNGKQFPPPPKQIPRLFPNPPSKHRRWVGFGFRISDFSKKNLSFGFAREARVPYRPPPTVPAPTT